MHALGQEISQEFRWFKDNTVETIDESLMRCKKFKHIFQTLIPIPSIDQYKDGLWGSEKMTLKAWHPGCFINNSSPRWALPQGLEVFMKNGLLRFYLIFMLMALALFSCENHDMSLDNSGTSQNNQNTLDRKPDARHPVEPNGAPAEGQKGKKMRKTYSRSSTLC